MFTGYPVNEPPATHYSAVHVQMIMIPNKSFQALKIDMAFLRMPIIVGSIVTAPT